MALFCLVGPRNELIGVNKCTKWCFDKKLNLEN